MNFASYYTIFGATSVNPIFFVAPSSNDVTWRVDAAGDPVGWTGSWPGVDQMVHWAITYNDATRVSELFINGISQGTRTFPAGDGYGANGNIEFGAQEGQPGVGYMNDVVVFPSILTAAQILSVYNAGHHGVVG